MKKRLKLSIPTPCHENWNDFSKTSTGGFCESCQKNVIDFSGMSDEEIINYFSKPSKNTCGKFRKSQIREYYLSDKSQKPTKTKWLAAGLFTFSMVTNMQEIQAQKADPIQIESEYSSPLNKQVTTPTIKSQDTTTVNGNIKDAEGYEVPGANVWIKGRDIGTISDINGNFELKEVSPKDILMISYIGFETLEYPMAETKMKDLELKLVMRTELMGEVVVGGVYSIKTGLWQSVKSLFQKP